MVFVGCRATMSKWFRCRHKRPTEQTVAQLRHRIMWTRPDAFESSPIHLNRNENEFSNLTKFHLWKENEINNEHNARRMRMIQLKRRSIKPVSHCQWKMKLNSHANGATEKKMPKHVCREPEKYNFVPLRFHFSQRINFRWSVEIWQWLFFAMHTKVAQATNKNKKKNCFRFRNNRLRPNQTYGQRQVIFSSELRRHLHCHLYHVKQSNFIADSSSSAINLSVICFPFELKYDWFKSKWSNEKWMKNINGRK